MWQYPKLQSCWIFPVTIFVGVFIDRYQHKSLMRSIPSEDTQQEHIRQLCCSNLHPREHELLSRLLAGVYAKNLASVENSLIAMDNPDQFSFVRNVREDYVAVFTHLNTLDK